MRIIYYIYTELCTFFNKDLFMWISKSRLVSKKKQNGKNRAKALQNVSFCSAGLRWKGVLPRDPLVYRVTRIFLAIIPAKAEQAE